MAANAGVPTQTERGSSDNEGSVGLRLRHPNVIRTHKFMTSEQPAQRVAKRARVDIASFASTYAPDTKHTWIVLEFCDRGTLQSAIDKGLLRTGNSTWRGGPSMRAVLAVAHDIAAGMVYLHAQGVVHGDLGPKNVLLVQDNAREAFPYVAKVSDFGLAHELNNDSTLQTYSYGTVTHMPVELVCNGRMTAAADVYAFGVMLWELYTGMGKHVHVSTDGQYPHTHLFRTSPLCWFQCSAAGCTKAAGWPDTGV